MKTTQVAGRLGRDIEMSMTGNGTAVTNFDLAVDGWDHQLKEKKTDWVPCVVWGQAAEFLGQYGKKGDFIAINGTLDFQTWESKKFTDESGNPAVLKKTVVKADMGGVHLVSGNKSGVSAPSTDFGDEPTKAPVAKGPTKSQKSLAEAVGAGEFKDIDFGGDDIPF